MLHIGSVAFCFVVYFLVSILRRIRGISRNMFEHLYIKAYLLVHFLHSSCRKSRRHFWIMSHFEKFSVHKNFLAEKLWCCFFSTCKIDTFGLESTLSMPCNASCTNLMLFVCSQGSYKFPCFFSERKWVKPNWS